MTTLAWDGKTLAADKQCNWISTPAPTTKIRKFKNSSRFFCGGGTGVAWECDLLMDYIDGEPAPDVTDESSLLLIDHSKRIWLMNKFLRPVQVELPQFAVGSGGDYALGAMLAGLDAPEAVLVACELDTKSGMGVDTIDFL